MASDLDRKEAWTLPIELAVGLALAGALAVSGCSNANQRATAWQPTGVERPAAQAPGEAAKSAAAAPAAAVQHGGVPRIRGVYKVGKPYVINGVTYVPAEDPTYDRVGMASWYGADFHGKQTANGELFDMDRISAAHPTLPLPSYVHVTNLRNGRSMIVRLNDRGPYKPGRIIDLSRRTAQLLGFEAQGTTEIRVRYAGPAPLDPTDDRRERQYMASQPWSKMVRAGWGPRYGLGRGTKAAP
jgi:rare lipoprotein A